MLTWDHSGPEELLLLRGWVGVILPWTEGSLQGRSFQEKGTFFVQHNHFISSDCIFRSWFDTWKAPVVTCYWQLLKIKHLLVSFLTVNVARNCWWRTNDSPNADDDSYHSYQPQPATRRWRSLAKFLILIEAGCLKRFRQPIKSLLVHVRFRGSYVRAK